MRDVRSDSIRGGGARYAAFIAALLALALLFSLTVTAPAAHAQGEGDGLDPEAAERMADEMSGDGSGEGSEDGSGDGGSGDGGSDEDSSESNPQDDGSVPSTESMDPGTRDAVEEDMRGDPAAQESLQPEEQDRPATDPSGEPLPEEAQDAVEEDSRGDPAAQGSVSEDRSQPNNNDSGGEESGSGSDEGGQSTRECSLSPKSSYAFQLLSPQDVEHDRSYMICGVGNYYLTYVDFSNVMQQLNPMPDPQQWTYNGFNGLASLAMELNAQMMAMTIDLLNFALDLNLVETLRGTVETVVGALGDGFYVKLYAAAGAVALVYVMWLIAKGRMQEAGFAVIKASFVMFIGLWLTGGQAADLATTVNNYQESLTNVAFTALTGINEGDQSAQALGCNSPKQCISANIWERYVYDPWANLQISENDQVAEKERDRILKISNPEDREQELKDLGNSNDEVKSVVDLVYATGHFLKAVLQFVVSFFFSFLVFTLVFCLIAAEIMMVALIMTAPIWMVAAIFPAAMLFERFIFYTLGEAAQIFGYKILIAIHLLLMNAIMSNFGTATGYLLACALTVAAFFKRKTLYKLLAPTGLARTLEARYKRGRQIKADAATARGGGMFAGGSGGGAGSPAAAGASAATGAPAAGARPVRQSFTEARQQMEANSFSPEGLRSGAAVVGAAGAGAAYREAKAAPGAVRDDTEARAEEAMRLNDLAQKRAGDPESLSDSERRELEQAEAMTEAGNDPLARASVANRGFVKDAKERRRHRKDKSGIGTYAALAGPRRDGESERSYLERQKAARKQANEQRRNLSDMAKNRQGFNIGAYPKTVSCTSCGKSFTASSAADTVCSDCKGGNGGGNDDPKKSCANCGNTFTPRYPGETLCPDCRGGNGGSGGGGGPGPGGPAGGGAAAPGPGTYAGGGAYGGAGRPRFTSSADGTVSYSDQGSDPPGPDPQGTDSQDTDPQDVGPYDDRGDSSGTVGRPRASDTPFEERPFEERAYDSDPSETGYTGGDTAGDSGPGEDAPVEDERFIGFGHPDIGDGATADGAIAGGTTGFGDTLSGAREPVDDSPADSGEDSEVRRPRGFEATTPEPADGSMERPVPVSEGTGSGATESGNLTEGGTGSEPQRPSKAQRFSRAGHTVLDAAGYIPAAGAVPDLANAGWYAAEGNRKDAAISAGAAIPVAGDSGKAIADANKAQKAAKIHARADRIERGLDRSRESSTGSRPRGDNGGLPSSVRPERFSREGGNGLWLPKGSSSSGSSAPQTGAASSEPNSGGTAQSSVSGSSTASAQRPPLQRSDEGQSNASKESPSKESSSEKSHSKEPSKESSVRQYHQDTDGKQHTQKPSERTIPKQKPSEPKPSELKPSRQEESRQSSDRSSATQGTGFSQGSGTDSGAGKSFSASLPDALRPERFSREGGSGLWLPNGSGTGSGHQISGEQQPGTHTGSGGSSTDSGGSGRWLPNSSSNSSGGSSSGGVQRPAPDTSRGAREDASRQSQQRADNSRSYRADSAGRSRDDRRDNS